MQREWLVPGAILCAGVLVAFALYSVRHQEVLQTEGNPGAVRPVDTTDHVLGNPAAPVVIIEYADIDSEYAKDFQKVMEQVMQNYGPQGNVAWVFRELPLTDANAGLQTSASSTESGASSNSEEHAEAAECVAALSGTTTFFKFIDALQTAAPGVNQFDPAGYDAVVTSLGLSSGTFDTCLAARTYQKRIKADYANAQEIGATGTPFSVLLVRGQKPAVISGSVPYPTMQQLIDHAISQALSAPAT